MTLFIFIYSIQMAICSAMNIYYETRAPKDGVDFLKLTFLPLCIYSIITKTNKSSGFGKKNR